MALATVKQFKAEGGFVTSPESNFGAITGTQLDIDNIRINGNTISATNTNGNINLTTTGTGQIVVGELSANTMSAVTVTADLLGNVTGSIKSATTSATILDTTTSTATFTGNVTGNIVSIGASGFTNITITGGSINNVPIGASTPNTGRFSTLISTTGITGAIGNTTKNTGQFTYLTADNTISALSTTESYSATTGSLVVFGGAGVAGNVNIGGSLVAVGTATAAPPTASTHLTTKNYVDREDVKNFALAIAFGL